MNKKIILVGSVIFLIIGLTFTQVSAQNLVNDDIINKEATAIDQFMDEVERISSESQNFYDFAQKFRDLCENNDYVRFPVIHEFVIKIMQLLANENQFSSLGINLDNLLGPLFLKSRPDYFVISFGVYHRLSSRKENSIDLFKERLSIWRYSDTSKLLKGRTLILQRQPFGIHQKMIGPQIGIMKGFRGLYIDIESKLTGNAYLMFLGRVHRIRAFDLTPLSK